MPLDFSVFELFVVASLPQGPAAAPAHDMTSTLSRALYQLQRGLQLFYYYIEGSQVTQPQQLSQKKHDCLLKTRLRKPYE